MNGGAKRLCFGTSTFVAGRLRPDKDSSPGKEALRVAVLAGVRLIHSNPKLGTQWAVREVLDEANLPVDHLVKAEVRLDHSGTELRETIHAAVERSRQELGIRRISFVVLEIDLKRTRTRRLLADSSAVSTFYSAGAATALETGQVGAVLAFSHSPAHLAAALRAELIDGHAARFNLLEPWPALYLSEIEASGRMFLGMAPLARGSLVRSDANTAIGRMAALRWALADPRVTAAVITLSSVAHLTDVMTASRRPLSARTVQQAAEAWLSGSPQEQLPGGTS